MLYYINLQYAKSLVEEHDGNLGKLIR